MYELKLPCFVRADIGLVGDEISIPVLSLSLAAGAWMSHSPVIFPVYIGVE